MNDFYDKVSTADSLAAKQIHPNKYLVVLVTLFITIYLTTGMVQSRLITIGHEYISSAIYIYPLSYLITDIVTEVYGYRVARQLIWCGILAWLFAGTFIAFIVHLTPPHFWAGYAKEFDFIMSPYLRYACSSAAGVLLGQFLNIYIIAKFKILARGRYFWLRSVTSSFIGDGITIFVALVFIYYGRMPLMNIFEIIFFEFLINIVYTAIIAFPAVYVVKFLKRAENMDVYDYNISFNPFKFKISS